MNGLGYSIPTNAWQPFLDLALKPRWDPPAAKAEEVFIIVRELSKDGCFTWKQWFRACLAVLNPGPYQSQNGFKCTVGNMLRAQVKHGTIVRMHRGQYCFPIPHWAKWQTDWKYQLHPNGSNVTPLMPRRPLYVNPGRFNMTPGERAGRAVRPRSA